MSGPAGTGKSQSILHKIHRLALQYPGSRHLILRKTRSSLTDSGLVTMETRVMGEENPICNTVQRSNRHSYVYPNGSEIVTGGMDKPTRLFSTDYDTVYVQECNELALDEWESLLRALRNYRMPYQQLIGDCNPDSPKHWLYQRAQDGRTDMRHCRHEHNPMLHDGDNWTPAGIDYIAKLERLTGVRYKRLRLGLWVAAEGTVYEFDPSIHLLDQSDIPKEWRRFRSIDFGYTNPFVCQWWAADPDGRLYLYREIYQTRRLVEDHAREILRLSEGETYDYTVADHDAEDRATLDRYGVHTVRAHKDVSPGIQQVQTRLKLAGDGKPRLYVLRDSLVERDEHLAEAKQPLSTLEEFDMYAWPKDQAGKSIKEQPVKQHDHGLDALRYLVASLDIAATGEAPEAGPSIW